MKIFKCLLFVIALRGAASVFAATSALTTRLDDPKAVYLERPTFDARGDGAATNPLRIALNP